MNLFSPLSLLWLIPLGGGIIILWMLRQRRQDVTVSSLYLWRALVKETPANAPFQKLRKNLLLFLQLLAAFLLILALARPFVWGQSLNGRSIVLIIDTSASMSATDVKPSRLDAAKAAAEQFIDNEMNNSDAATIISASGKPAERLSFTSDKGRLKQILSDIPSTDTVADIPAACTLAQSLIGAANNAVVRIYSDGGYGVDAEKRVASISLNKADVKFIPIGSTDPDNIGITAMDSRRDPTANSYEVFVEVENLGKRLHPGLTLTMLKDNKVIDSRSLTLEGGKQSETFSGNLLKQGGTVTARIDNLSDDLACDNSASLVLPPPRERKALLVSHGNIFLERGLNLDPDVTLEEVAPSDFATLGKNGSGYAMVVFDGWMPAAKLPQGNYLLFNAAGKQTPFEAMTGTEDNPELVDQSHTHPVMRFVDLSGLSLFKAGRVKLAPWAEPLAESDSGALIAAGDHEGSRMISVGFDLSDSDWPLRVSFPIFLTNAVNWLTAAGGLGASTPDTQTGAVASLAVPAGLSNLKVTEPDGKADWLAAPASGGIVLYDQTTHAGLYRVTGSGYDHNLAVNLLNKEESNLHVQNITTLNHAGASTISRTVHAKHVRSDYWQGIAWAALVLLIIEWLVFHRKI